MSGNEQLFELMSKMYGEMQEGFKDVKGRLDKVEGRFDGVEGELASVKKTVIHIENEHGKKLQALFDGHTQINSQLERIENEVTRHEEIIIRKVK
ncbi:hypothetical protein [Proteiniborus sp. MB09-C3]|uniref:hypothetical protein n=1 Tax=Proteiniborus sp. MB09-C3 TaxID=3050072 RepID=UPI002557665A|nr:hypothetical protein [Proteiniborus sp. MB09-C3]WIV11842.1 hypothetical protein QO263_17320 [Proteiniborus sp. MB09-C3]